MKSKYSRRTIITTFFIFLLGSCKGKTRNETKDNDSSDIKIKIGKISDFEIPYIPLTMYRVAIIRSVVNSKVHLKAISLVCTHQTCLISKVQRVGLSQFECPCHGSEFADDGEVLKGPAVKPLPWKKLEIVGSDIFLYPQIEVDKSWSLEV